MNCKKQICSPLHIFYIRVDLYIKHGVRMMMLFMEIHFIYKPLRSEERKKTDSGSPSSQSKQHYHNRHGDPGY